MLDLNIGSQKLINDDIDGELLAFNGMLEGGIRTQMKPE
jgi:hypothetical protein